MGTLYPPKAQQVRIWVQISTHGYEYVYGYEFLPMTFFVDGRVIDLPDPNLTRYHPYLPSLILES
jgi:hypothetical protein